jgi:outer membrane protein assembly factor BamA
MQPEISPDEKTLVYVGYTHEGYDLFAMDIDPSKFLDVPEYVDDRPPPPPEPRHVLAKRVAYNPFHTLVPRSYVVGTSPSDFGQAFGISVSGSDIAGWHSLSASLTFETQDPDPQFNINYDYGRLPFDLVASAYRSIAPGPTYTLGSNSVGWVQSAIGASVGINYSIPRAFETHNFSIGYSVNSVYGDIGFAQQPINPYDTPQLPSQQTATLMSIGWSYGNAQSFLWGVSAEKGFNVSASLDLSHPVIGSDYRGFRAKADFTTYVAMPWLRHHVVALHAGGGMMGGNFPGGPFYVGGFVDLGPQDQATSFLNGGNFLYQSGFVLRGYPVAVQTGQYYTLAQAEYRFPIVNIDRGPSTVPLMLNRINGNVFFDLGSAFDDPRSASYLSGVGAELWVDTTLGYFAAFNFRVGYARGLAKGGIDKVYFVAAVPY